MSALILDSSSYSSVFIVRVDGQKCESGCKRKSTMKDYRISLVISFVLKLKGDERIDRDGLWLCFSFITVMEVCRQMGSYMERNG